jgi:hypothetical protein
MCYFSLHFLLSDIPFTACSLRSLLSYRYLYCLYVLVKGTLFACRHLYYILLLLPICLSVLLEPVPSPPSACLANTLRTCSLYTLLLVCTFPSYSLHTLCLPVQNSVIRACYLYILFDCRYFNGCSFHSLLPVGTFIGCSFCTLLPVCTIRACYLQSFLNADILNPCSIPMYMSISFFSLYSLLPSLCRFL